MRATVEGVALGPPVSWFLTEKTATRHPIAIYPTGRGDTGSTNISGLVLLDEMLRYTQVPPRTGRLPYYFTKKKNMIPLQSTLELPGSLAHIDALSASEFVPRQKASDRVVHP